MGFEGACGCDHAHELEKALLVITELEDTITKLQGNIETISIEGDRNLSHLQQQKYDLELRLSRHVMMAESYQDDLEAMQREYALDKKNAVKEAESKLLDQCTKLRLDLSSVEGDLEKSKVTEVELQQENDRLEEVVEKLKAQIKVKEMEKVPNESFSNSSFSEEVDALRKQNSVICEENLHLQTRIDQMEKKMARWKEEAVQKDAEICKLAYESVSYFNENERLKEKIKDLQVEIEIITMQSNKKSAKGNSLFAEVEDRRAEVEKELYSMRSENNLLKQKLKKATDDLHIIKMQQTVKWDIISAMEYRERLQSVLAQNKHLLDENKLLGYKLKAVESHEEMLKSKFLNKDKAVDSESRRYQILFESSEQKLKELTGNFDKKSITLCMVESRLMNSESDLSRTKQELFGVVSQNEKMKMKIEELINKYEPEKHEQPQKPKKMEFCREKLNFSSRKKFHLDSNADSSETTPYKTSDGDLHPQVASDSFSNVDGSRTSRSSERASSGNKLAPTQETILEEISLNCSPDHEDKIKEDEMEVTQGDENSQKNLDDIGKATSNNREIQPTGNCDTVCINKENRKDLEVVSASNGLVEERTKDSKEESKKVMSLQDELAAFACNDTGGMNTDGNISRIDGHDNDNDISKVLKESSKINTDVVSKQKVADDMKVAASNPASAPTSQSTVGRAKRAAGNYNRKKIEEETCKTQ